MTLPIGLATGLKHVPLGNHALGVGTRGTIMIVIFLAFFVTGLGLGLRLFLFCEVGYLKSCFKLGTH